MLDPIHTFHHVLLHVMDKGHKEEVSALLTRFGKIKIHWDSTPGVLVSCDRLLRQSLHRESTLLHAEGVLGALSNQLFPLLTIEIVYKLIHQHRLSVCERRWISWGFEEDQEDAHNNSPSRPLPVPNLKPPLEASVIQPVEPDPHIVSQGEILNLHEGDKKVVEFVTFMSEHT